MKKKYYCSMPYARYRHADIRGIFNHNERQEGCYDNNCTLDISRKDLNYHLKKPEGYYLDMIRKKITDLGIKERKNSVLMCEFVISASKEWINSLNEVSQRNYLEYAYEFMVARFGEENVLSAVVHNDESFPHMHVCLVPVTKDGRLNINDFLGGGRYALSELIDEFYYHISKVYPELHRGIPWTKTRREKIPLYLYRCVDDIYDQHRDICNEIVDINLLNLSTQKILALKDMQKFIVNIAKVRNAVKSTDEHIHNIEAALFEKENEIRNLKSQIQEYAKKINDMSNIQKIIDAEDERCKKIVSQLKIADQEILLMKAEDMSSYNVDEITNDDRDDETGRERIHEYFPEMM